MSDQKKRYQQNRMKMYRREMSLMGDSEGTNPARFEAGAGFPFKKLELRERKHFRKKKSERKR